MTAVSESQRNPYSVPVEDETIGLLRAEHRMLEKKLAERRLLMERVWEEKLEEDEKIRREEADALEADIIGQQRVEAAQRDMERLLEQMAAEEAAAALAAQPPPLLMPKLEASEHETKMAKIRAREAAKGLRY